MAARALVKVNAGNGRVLVLYDRQLALLRQLEQEFGAVVKWDLVTCPGCAGVLGAQGSCEHCRNGDPPQVK